MGEGVCHARGGEETLDARREIAIDADETEAWKAGLKLLTRQKMEELAGNGWDEMGDEERMTTEQQNEGQRGEEERGICKATGCGRVQLWRRNRMLPQGSKSQLDQCRGVVSLAHQAKWLLPRVAHY